MSGKCIYPQGYERIYIYIQYMYTTYVYNNILTIIINMYVCIAKGISRKSSDTQHYQRVLLKIF